MAEQRDYDVPRHIGKETKPSFCNHYLVSDYVKLLHRRGIIAHYGIGSFSHDGLVSPISLIFLNNTKPSEISEVDSLMKNKFKATDCEPYFPMAD